jgi:hypothetical protein
MPLLIRIADNAQPQAIFFQMGSYIFSKPLSVFIRVE